MADALPLFDQALSVTESDPSLADLRLLLQLNQAVALGNLDRYEEALAVAGQARHLADQVGTTQPAGAGAQRLEPAALPDWAMGRRAGRAEGLPEELNEPGVVCCDLGIAAIISFHRGETGVARRHLAAAVPTPSGSDTGSSAHWRWPGAWTVSTTARLRRHSPS